MVSARLRKAIQTVTMKTKMEAIANLAVMVVVLAAGYVVLRGELSDPRLPTSVAAGDRLAEIPGLDLSHHRRTLVLALNTACHYCQDSASFYQKLIRRAHQLDGDDLQVVAVFPNSPESVQQALKRDGLSIRSIASIPLATLGVIGTPTLVLVDREGRVERSWLGLLAPRQELDVWRAAFGTLQGCSPSGLFALLPGLGRGCESGTN